MTFSYRTDAVVGDPSRHTGTLVRPPAGAKKSSGQGPCRSWVLSAAETTRGIKPLRPRSASVASIRGTGE